MTVCYESGPGDINIKESPRLGGVTKLYINLILINSLPLDKEMFISVSYGGKARWLERATTTR